MGMTFKCSSVLLGKKQSSFLSAADWMPNIMEGHLFELAKKLQGCSDTIDIAWCI